MKLIFPGNRFNLKVESDRVIINTDGDPQEDRDFDRETVAKMLNRSRRMIDMYRRAQGEARLHSTYTADHRIVIKESELKRWLAYTQKSNPDLARYLNGSASSFRPWKKWRRSLEKQ